MEELISVIVPIYNVEKYLNICVDSILNQTYKNLEIILVDDGSTDNCGKICDKYAQKDNRIKVIHKENEGVSSARNVGIENANGSYIAFVDGDDWIEKWYCNQLLEEAIQQKSDVVVCAYNRIIDNRIEKCNINQKKQILNSEEYLMKALNPQTGFGFCHMKLIKKNVIKKVRFNQKLVVGEDALFNMQMCENINKAVFIPKALYNYRNNCESVVKKYDEKYVDKYYNAMKVTKKYIFDNYEKEEIKQNYYNFVTFHIMLIAVNYCYNPNNNEKKKIKLLKKICDYDEFKEAIYKSNYKDSSLTRVLTLYTLKNKFYILTALICKIRQFQNIKTRER